LQNIKLKLNVLLQHGMGNFNNVFLENYALLRILLSGNFISLLISKLHGGVYRCKYLCFIDTSHSALIVFSVEIMFWSKFYEGKFIHCAYQGISVESIDVSGVCRYK
jgi:hypothetical protein